MYSPRLARGSARHSRQCRCRVIEHLLSHSRQQGCYKVILDCAEANVPFYEKCGFRKKEVQMVRLAGLSNPCCLPHALSGRPQCMHWLCCRRTTSDQMPDLPAFDQIQVPRA